MRFRTETLGCKVNQTESGAIAAMLRARGHIEVTDELGYDVCIINTCAVTGESSRKSRQAVRRMRRLAPDAVIAVCGCLSQLEPDEVAEALGADLVGGSGDREKFVSELEKTVVDRKKRIITGDIMTLKSFEHIQQGGTGERTRGFLKIQDGCDNYCAYCVIPFARGHIRSLPVGDACEIAAKMARDGYRELVITGIEIASYGKDLQSGVVLDDVVCTLSRTVPDVRLRLGSLEPRAITEEFCKRLSACGNVCSHFHLSLQSGCDATLKRMKRRYITRDVETAVSLLRRNFPNCGITADLITGFPGETDEEFDETLTFIKNAGFSDLHVFPFSPRKKTAAFDMPDQIDKAVRQKRAADAIRIGRETRDEFIKTQIGKTVTVLFERSLNDAWVGYSDNYLDIAVCGDVRRNSSHEVQIKSYKKGIIWGELV